VQPKEWLQLCLLRASDLQLTQQGMAFNLRHAQQDFSIAVPLLGAFNAENLLCAVSCVLANGFDEQKVVAACQNVQPVAGRMQSVHHQPTVVVDFAHTADALQKLLEAVAEHQKDQPIMVLFGCGGDRDKQKRPKMAQIAERYANQLIITSDNPRSEDPQQIIDEVVAGLLAPEKALLEIDRKAAIEMALQKLQDNPQAILVIAGKGHEDYQEIAGKRYPFSDAKVVENWFSQHEK
jgi:UDP-N-acetylmuramoyl-L-alanyl-D-glutamate--2,6-diaminopimelate ligase